MNKRIIFSIIAIAACSIACIQKGNNSTDENNSEYKSEAKEVMQTPKIDGHSNKAAYELPAPLTDRDEQIVEHTGYTLSYNKSHNTPNWSAWKLTKEKTDGTAKRSSKFWADPKISQLYRVDYYDYKGSGYDRGHMCPAGDMKWSEDAMHDCFYMSNMCPQEHTLNNGSWKKLEESCRQWAINEGAIYIICGPVYKGKKHERIGIDHVIDVPEGFFKAVLSLRKGHEKAIGFYYDNSEQRQSMTKTAMTIDALEELTGIDFFYQLDDKTESKLESSYSLQDWNH